MAYGSIKVDNVIYTKGGVDTTITVSGIVDSLSGAISVTGAISGASVSAATGTFTTLSGNTTAGTTATFTSGVFTTFSGTTVNVVSGVFASGTVALPSVSVGTSSNGLYSPGANQLAISTSGTGRLTVDNSGNVNIDSGTFYVDAVNNRVGVGTTSPQASLQALDRIKVSDSTQAQGSLVLGDGASTLFNVGIARWNGSTNAPGAGGMGYFSQGTANSGGHYFYTGDAAAGSTTLRLTLDASGNLGVGTNNPIAKLHVSNGGAAGIEISPLTAFNGPNIQAYNRSGAAYVPLDFSASSFFWYISGNQRMQLDASGNLGLGVVPSANWNNAKAYQVGIYAAYGQRTTGTSELFMSWNATITSGNSLGTGYVYRNSGDLASAYTQNGNHIWYIAPSGTADATTSITNGRIYTVTTLGATTLGQWQTYFSGLSALPSVGQTITATNTGTLAGGATVTEIINFTQAMTLDASGRLGIGTTSPGQLLDVSGNIATNGSLYVYNSTRDGLGIWYNPGGAGVNQLTARVAGSDRLTIDSSGNLLVGTSTSPGAGELLRIEKASTGTEGAGIRFGGTYTIANDGTQTFTVGNGTLVFISNNTTGNGALFFCSLGSATISLLSDPDGAYATSVTAGRVSLTKSAGGNTITLTNKSGASRSFTIGKINNSD